MSSTLQIKRGTRQRLDELALKGQLLPGEPLLITDENRLAVAVSTTQYEAAATEGETASGAATWGAITGTLSAQTDLNTALSGKEPSITAGTTSQFWRGDKSWTDFATTVRASTLTGLSTVTNAVITAADTVLSALGKLQKQISDHFGAGGTAHANATTTVAGFMSGTDKTKLDGIATGATANTGTVTSVGGTGTVSGISLSGTVTNSGNLTLGGALAVTPSNFASQTANTFLAAPNGAAGVPTFRGIVAADVPVLNQNTTGSAATLTTARNINGVSFNGSADILVPSLYDATYRRITNPGGGQYITSTASVTGALAIALPTTVYGQSKMVTFRVTVYEYLTGESIQIQLSGYQYSAGNWLNMSGYILAQSNINRNYSIRFAKDTTNLRYVIYVGELTTTWDYPQVFITDVQNGYGSNQSGWESGWSIYFESTAFATVAATINNPQIGYSSTANIANALVLRDASGNFAAGTITLGGIQSTAVISVLNASAAQGIKVGNLVVSNSYANNAPTNGIYVTGQVQSAVATGTSPFTIASTTLNTNLNADLLDGLHADSANTASTVVARDASGNFSAGTITASLSGNASTVTNGVYTTGSYADPAWITSINYSKLTGTVPTWNQNTTGTAANVTGTVAVANGGTGSTTAVNARTALQVPARPTAFPASNENAVQATDIRNITNPTTGLGYAKGVRFRFSSLNDDSSTPYADVIDLSTYQDSSGGGFNALYFGKNSQLIQHKYAAAAGTAWTVKTVAYTDSNITGTASNVTGTVAVANGGTGATTAPAALTNLGATTVGSSFFTVANPSAIRFARVNADNTVSLLSDADFRTAIGVGAGGGGSTAPTDTEIVATAGQTVFSVTYSPTDVSVYLNGVRLNAADYTATNGTSITLTVGALAGSVLKVRSYAGVASANAKENIVYVTGNLLATQFRVYVFRANATLTLPASPVEGDWVRIVNRSGLTSCVIARNGLKIMGLLEDLTLDTVTANLTLVYTDTTDGWVFV